MSASTAALEPCEFLEWDSAFFRRRIARARAGTLDEASALRLLDWCRDHDIECLYFLAASDDASTVRIAEDLGFRLVDIRVTFERRGALPPDDPSAGHGRMRIRPAEASDAPELRAIARTAFRMGRFHGDPHFPESSAVALYETWTEKSCHGYADRVLIAEIDGKPAGYISCHLNGDDVGQIGLIGVREDCRSQGIGVRLVDASLRWFGERGATRVRVVTQGGNRAAQRMYERRGFLVDSVELWYHRWFIEDGSGSSAGLERDARAARGTNTSAEKTS